MQRSGARQWRHDCDCHPVLAAARDSQPWERMHSQVSAAHLASFVEGNRVGESMTLADLREIYEAADGAVIVCYCCGSLKVVGDD